MITELENKEISGIPIRNLWLLVLYASDLYREMGRERTKVEEDPEDIANLVAEVLTNATDRRLRRHLSSDFVSRSADLRRVRGRIDHFRTARHQLMSKGQIACRFEILSTNTPSNQLVLTALERIRPLVKKDSLRNRCRDLAKRMTLLGVERKSFSQADISIIRTTTRDREESAMFAAAKLALELQLLTEQAGIATLPKPFRDPIYLRKLFEHAVAGFYQVNRPPDWTWAHGRQFNWPCDSSTACIASILPIMKTDIVLENQAGGRRIIIDTKFNQILTSGYYSSNSLRSGYVYQIYSYVRAAEDSGDPLAANATGILLHPSVGVDIMESTVIHGHRLVFATVNLNGSAMSIRNRLQELIA